MPIYACENGKFRIGEGECIYTSRDSAERAYAAYLAQENNNKKSMIYNYKSFNLEVKDVDTKQGVVTGYFSAFGKSIGENIAATPDLVATQYPLLSAAWFFNKNGLHKLADKGATPEVVTI